MATVILLTGQPGVGKTTILKHLISQHEDTSCGFVTDEIRAGRRRTGFVVRTWCSPSTTLTGANGPETYLLASVEPLAGRNVFTVGRYFCSTTSLDSTVLPNLEMYISNYTRQPKGSVDTQQKSKPSKMLVAIDEIGTMELRSPVMKRFLHFLRIESKQYPDRLCIVATIGTKHLNTFQQPNDLTYIVTVANRDKLRDEIAQSVNNALVGQ